MRIQEARLSLENSFTKTTTVNTFSQSIYDVINISDKRISPSTSLVDRQRSRRFINGQRHVMAWKSLVFIALSLLLCCDLATCNPSSNPSLGVWSHFVANATKIQGLESSMYEENQHTFGLSNGVGNSRRSRKTEIEFPDADLILTSREEMEYAQQLWRNGPCTCWNSSDSHQSQREVECKCSDSNFTQLGTITLPVDVYRLTIENAKNFTTLSNEDLRPYSGTLSELILTELPQFREIKSDTFHRMVNLTTIYIHEAHSLKEINDDVFKVFLPKLKIIRVIYTALETVPNLSQLHVMEELHMVEFENSKITKLRPGSFHNLQTEHLSLGYNQLTEIGPRTFNGSTISRLGLNGNRQLTKLHPESFLGIRFLRLLDLSETSITYLPTEGLSELEVLRLENVWTLGVIPSIYHFQSLKEASLTWPYHCCAFANPEQHDPVSYQTYQEHVRSAVQKHCDTASATSTTSISTTTSDSETPQVAEHKTLHRFPRSRTNNEFPLKLKFFSRRSVNRVPEAIKFQQYSKNQRKFTLRGSRISRETKNSDKKGHDTDANLNGLQIQDEPVKRITEHERLDSHDPYAFGNVLDSNPYFGSEVNPWEAGSFGHDDESRFDEEMGIFHHEVQLSSTVNTSCGNVVLRKHPPRVLCKPLPDAYNPCEDIMGSLWLRGAVWVVVALSLVGNTAVLVVLLLAPGRMSVQRFLMANLSWADLCMGIYLLMIATQDIVSLGNFFNYAVDWQVGWGCKIAGFLTIFSSELSVFTLVVITGERWYALTRAIHLTKRLSIVGAAQLMLGGWTFSIILAALPLVGVSSYSKTSICLPMEAGSTGSQVYLSFLLLFNGLAFLLVATAYINMYRAVAGHGGGGSAAAPGASSADTAIAKKMALLVFTDFACWAPVAFFGLTAVAGYPLIGVTDSKILLVFFYPLNSTLNPYLYAIMTKQYRRDLLLLLSRHGICTRRAAKYKAGGVSTNTLQTMNTVLRLGSMTETKLSQHHNSPNGGGGPKDLKSSETSPRKTSPTNNAPKIVQESGGKTSSHIFDYPLLTGGVKNLNNEKHNERPFQEETDLNSVNGRLLAETSFISIPTPGKSSGCLKKAFGGNNKGKHVKLVTQDSTIMEDEHDQENEISENTPFVKTSNDVSQ